MEYPVDVVFGGAAVHGGRRGAAQQLVDGSDDAQHLGPGDAPVAVHVVEREHPRQLLLHRPPRHPRQQLQELLGQLSRVNDDEVAGSDERPANKYNLIHTYNQRWRHMSKLELFLTSKSSIQPYEH